MKENSKKHDKGRSAREERLQKFISTAGVCSRRKAEELILSGLVTVNGKKVTRPETRVDPDGDVVKVDGERIKLSVRRTYVLLYKPKGVISSVKDPRGRPTVLDLVPFKERLYPVGRLDFQSEGLMILSNDGAFMEAVTGPGNTVTKVYRVKVRGVPDEKDLRKLRSGILIDGRTSRVHQVRIIEGDNNAWLEISLREGKNRQKRKMLDKIRHPVVKLKRIRIGPYTAKGLKPGQWRTLSKKEVEKAISKV